MGLDWHHEEEDTWKQTVRRLTIVNAPIPEELRPTHYLEDWKKSQTFIPTIEEEQFVPVSTKDLRVVEAEFKERQEDYKQQEEEEKAPIDISRTSLNLSF